MSISGANRKPVFNDPEYLAETAASTLYESAIVDVDTPNDNEDIRWLREQRLHHKSLSWIEKPTVAKLCFTLLIWFISFGVSISSKIILLLEIICNYATDKYGIESCHDSLVQELTSSLQLKLIFVTGFTAALVCGKLGEYSDIFGRKKVFIFMGTSSLIGRLISLYLYKPTTEFHTSWFILMTIIDNLGGGMIGMLSVANSYITDIVDPHDRIISLGFSNGSMYAGMGLGPLIGGLLVYSTKNNFITLYVDAFLSFTFLVLVIFLIKESRSKKLRSRSQSFHMQRKESFVSQMSQHENKFKKYVPFWRVYEVFSPLKILWLPKHKTLGLRPRINVIFLVIIESFLMCASISYVNPLLLYTTFKFNWNSEMISYYISLSGIFKTSTLYIISPIFQHIIRKFLNIEVKSLDRIDFLTILVGGIFELISPLMIISAEESIIIYLTTLFGSLAAIAIPSLQGSIIKYMKENKAGEVFGALGLIKNIIVMLGPSGFLFIYSNSVNKLPTLVFYVAILFILVGISFTLFLQIHDPVDENDYDDESIINETNSTVYGILIPNATA